MNVNRAELEAATAVQERLDCIPDCPICHGAGWITNIRPVWDPEFGQAYPCPQRALTDEGTRRRHRASCLPAGLKCSQFEDFEQRQGAEEALEAAKDFAEGHTDNCGLTLAGAPGNGKTTLLACIGNAMLGNGYTVKYGFVPEMVESFRATFRDNSEISFAELLLKYQNADVLLLDDIGDKRVTDFAIDAMYALIDDRYRNGKLYVVTTNITPVQMEMLWGRRVTDRVFDEGSGAVRLVYNTAASYRTGR